MKSSRESVHRGQDWRERQGEGNVRTHKLLNRIHCTSCWNMSPSNIKTSEWSFHMLCVVSCMLFLFSSSHLFLECYFPSSFDFYQPYQYLLSLLQELFNKHLSAVKLAISPWGSRIVFFFLFLCRSLCVFCTASAPHPRGCGLSRITRKNGRRQRLVLGNLGINSKRMKLDTYFTSYTKTQLKIDLTVKSKN